MYQIETYIYLTPQLEKQLHAAWYGYARPSGIKRTRKRQIPKAKFMDHGSYEWSQWWHSKARKPKRWKK